MAPGKRIYLDYAATTPVDSQVLAAMKPFFDDEFGNPSSIHWSGQRAEAAVEDARESVAELIGSKPQNIVFTSGGTESDNLALRGTAFNRRKKFGADRLLISPVEHPAVSATCRQLVNDFGFFLDILPVNESGGVDPHDVERAITKKTAVVSVIYANNEIGTINQIQEIGEVCQRKGVPFHSDAVQAAAHLEMNVDHDHINFLSIGAHKFHGPKGVGALTVDPFIEILPIQTGGVQENGKRAGTQNVPYIAGMAAALKLSAQDREERNGRLSVMRDHLIGQVLEEIPNSKLTGHLTKRLPNHASFIFKGADGNRLVSLLDTAGFAVSSGSACKVGIPKPSEVLLAIACPEEWALGSLRVTLGKETLSSEVDAFLSVLPEMVAKARK